MGAHCCFRDARYFPVVPSGGRMNGFRLPALPLAVLAVWLATALPAPAAAQQGRSEEDTSELQSLMRISYAVFCLQKKKKDDISRLNHMQRSAYNSPISQDKDE